MLGEIGDRLGNLGPSANETRAYDALAASAQAPNPYAPAIGTLASDLLAGGGPGRGGIASNAYDSYRDALAPFARGDFLDPSRNPYTSQILQTIGNDVQSRINSMFAGAGRDLSGMNQQALARGIAEGSTPTLASLYTQAQGNQLAALDKLYNAGNATAGVLSGFDQAALANRQAGVGVAGAALAAREQPYTQSLALEAQRRGIPLQTLTQLNSLLVPLAGLGRSSSGDTTSTQTQDVPMWQKIAGGAIGGVGLLGRLGAFGPAGFLMGGR